MQPSCAILTGNPNRNRSEIEPKSWNLMVGDKIKLTLLAIRCGVSTSMGGCLWVGKPSGYETSDLVNSAFHPCRVDNRNRYKWSWKSHESFWSVFCSLHAPWLLLRQSLLDLFLWMLIKACSCTISIVYACGSLVSMAVYCGQLQIVCVDR